MKVGKEQRTSGRPQLTPEAAGGVDVLVGTVEKVELLDSQFKGQVFALTFKEMPEHSYRLNKTGTDIICVELGDDTDDWVGERIPLVKTRQSVAGKTHVVFAVAASSEWKSLLAKSRKK